MATLSVILGNIYRDIGEPSSPATTTTTRLTQYINEGLRIIVSDPCIADRVRGHVQGTTNTMPITSVASQARYVVRDAAAQIIRIADRTNDYTLQSMTHDEYRLRTPDPSAYTGTPTRYVDLGFVAVEKVPTNASQIFVKSTDAADTTQTAFVEVVRTNGVRGALSATLNGTTAVSLNASITDVVDIHDFYLSASGAGTVTLHEDSGSGTQLAFVAIGQSRPRYTGILLWPTPAASDIDYAVDFLHQNSGLENAGDEPQFPPEFHWLLEVYARMRHYEKSDDGRYRAVQEQWEQGRKDLRYWMQRRDPVQVVGRSRRIGISRLGGYYPADTWIDG